MTVYGEYLFLENFVAGYGIIRLTALLCGRRPGRARLVSGALLCGIFAFVLLLNLSRVVALGIEVLFAVVLMMLVFGPCGGAAVARLAAVFFAVSFIIGGAAVAFIYWTGVRGIVSNGILYIGNHGYLLVFTGGAIGIILMKLVIDYIRKRAPKGDEYMKVTVEIMGVPIRCTGKLDTGNSLKDPVSGKPVSLIRRELAESKWGDLIFNLKMNENFKDDINTKPGFDFSDELYEYSDNHFRDELKSRLRLIPFKSVGCSSGMLTAIRCDSLTIHKGDLFGSQKIQMKDVYLGLYDGSFNCRDGERYDILLQPDVVNGGHEL
ncbi:MAG: sigma-E processing peptidase SpoIIGA [Firmicutes bacterium]|nr:sigma-E processing peptidase SpoIIGA [Bacillota bacterium]